MWLAHICEMPSNANCKSFFRGEKEKKRQTERKRLAHLCKMPSNANCKSFFREEKEKKRQRKRLAHLCKMPSNAKCKSWSTIFKPLWHRPTYGRHIICQYIFENIWYHNTIMLKLNAKVSYFSCFLIPNNFQVFLLETRDRGFTV